MLGKTVEAVGRSERGTGHAEVAARVEGLRTDTLEALAFEMRRGEVVGLTGLPGSGFEAVRAARSREVAEPAGGSSPPPPGQDSTCPVGRRGVHERSGRPWSPRSGSLEGLAVELSIRDNIAIPSIRRRGRPWHVARRWQEDEARSSIRRLGIRSRSRTCSSRSSRREPAEGPLRQVALRPARPARPPRADPAVDVGARVDILRAIAEAASRGVGVLLVSIEPSDLAEVCDRILVHGHAGAPARAPHRGPRTRSCTPSTPSPRSPQEDTTHD